MFLSSPGEFQRLLSESTGFIFYGTEKYLGSLKPSMLAPMSVTGIITYCILSVNILLYHAILKIQPIRMQESRCVFGGIPRNIPAEHRAPRIPAEIFYGVGRGIK